MPVGYLTSSDLIATIKREAMIPTSQSTFSNADFLAMANQEMRIGLVPSILQYHEEYYARDSAPVTIVANQSNYPIPYRSVGGKFREVFYMNTDGSLRSMTRISPDDRPHYQDTNSQNNFIFFYLKGNEVVLVPNVSSNPVGSLVFTFYMRPNELVDEGRVANITNVATGASTTVYTVDAIPSGLTSFVQGGTTVSGFSTASKLDVLQRNPGHKTIAYDIYPTIVDSVNKQITFNNTDINDISTGLSSIVPGDYIAFAGECIIPQAPADLHDVLAQRVAMRCLQSLGDQASYQLAQSKLQEMEKWTGTIVDNRSEGQAKKVTNHRGLLRSSKIRRW